MPVTIIPNDTVVVPREDYKCLELKQRIVNAFEERAKDVGVRAVSTDEMAKTLSISKKTLYKQFRSKEELVEAVLDRWASSIKKPVQIEIGENPKTIALLSVQRWYDNDSAFCQKFWEDVEEDYPALKSKYYSTMHDVTKQIAIQLAPFRKPCYSEDFLRETYFLLVISAADSSFYEKAKMERREAVLKSVELWLDGAFNLPDVYEK